MHGEDAKARNRFCKVLKVKMDETENEQETLKEDYLAKEPDGTFKKYAEGQKYVIKPGKEKKYADKWKAIGDTQVMIEIDASMKKDLNRIKNLLQKFSDEFTKALEEKGYSIQEQDMADLYEEILAKLK